MKALRCPYCHADDVSSYNGSQMADCFNCGRIFGIYQEAKDIFHRLWSMATRSADYDKKLWHRIQEIIGF